ncbi:aminotransferase gliI [Aspergillus neoniger CBS 115656]|uniref:Aminotransferase GliI-like protein n=1 Tax=Aspergillus neoniger (strain CBS 115656) TaxID=1448310 RepID=A0A318YLS6_ASPNB|nr:aminotransferase GliI-like protein [Aspergillus neoniger CBS 115656]PYH35561.1 aminotransferase GliI-like protein [Aspergillus neoniger CBS 115656]
MESSFSHRGHKNLTDVLTRFPPYLLNPNFTWHGIDLTLAENHVIRSEILSILKTCIGEGLSSQHLDWPKGLCGYPPLLDALATTFNRYFEPYTPIETDHLAVTPGTSAGLDILLYQLCDPEDGVLVPCPYWSGYDTFFAVRSQVQIIGVEVTELEESFHDSTLVTALEKHYKEAKCPIKAVVLSHPHNPLGRPYPPHVLKQCMAFCRDHNLHLISDEVFALSTFTSPGLQNWSAFKSVLSIDPSTVGLDPSRVHVLWSMSKDLAASGIRLGCIATRNNPLRRTVGLAGAVQVSALSTIGAIAILTSSRLPDILKQNCMGLAVAYCTVTEAFRRIGITYIPGTAAVFLMARLAPRAQTREDELAACGKYRQAGVAVVPGSAYHMPGNYQHGWMRVTFGVAPETLTEGIRRIEGVFGELR